MRMVLTDAERKAHRRASNAKWRNKNKDRIKEYNATWNKNNKEYYTEWRKANPEKVKRYAHRNNNGKESTYKWRRNNRDRYLSNLSKWRSENKDKALKGRIKWNNENREAKRLYDKEYRRNNPEKVKATLHNKRARKKSNGGKLSPDILLKLYDRQKGKCAICGKRIKISGSHVDHVIPFARGGKNIDSNVQLTCSKCNMKKGAKDPIQYMQSLGYLL